MRRDCWPPKRRFILIIHYGAASIIASSRNAATTRDYSEISELTGLKVFVTTLPDHAAAEATRN